MIAESIRIEKRGGNISRCEELERHEIIARAQRWLDAKVPYEFKAFYEGYRTQCSGFVAAAWNLDNPEPQNTPRCYNLESRGLAHVLIDKSELLMGDVLVCNSKKHRPLFNNNGTSSYSHPKEQQGGGHCLIFEQWTLPNKTSYIGWELCNDATCHGMIRREIPYPYFYKENCWEPMRRTNISKCT